METFLAPYRPQLLSIFRIMSGLLVLQFGTAKIIGFPAVQSFANVAVGKWPTWYAGVIELIFGALLVIGMFSPLANGGTLAILFCFAFLYLAAAGPGPWSVDAVARGKQ